MFYMLLEIFEELGELEELEEVVEFGVRLLVLFVAIQLAIS
jgi:hypothetical protein